MQCPTCQFDNPDGMKFCGQCGSRLLAPVAAEDERRVVTAISADVSGFTAMSEQLDPEAVKEIMSECLGLLADEVVRFGGKVDKFAGDAILAYFGAPIAHGDDPERAVRCGLAMQEVLGSFAARLEQQRGIVLKMRIGLHTGAAVTGVLHSDQSQSYTITGDTLLVATRVQAQASPGRVAVSDSTYRLTSSFFQFEPLAAVSIEGKQEPIPLHHLVGVRQQGGKVKAGEGLAAPLVGRAVELQQLSGTFEQVVALRQPALVTLWGAAGQGKSRLVAEFHAQLGVAENPALLIRGRCLPFGQEITHWPLSEMLKDDCSIRDSDTRAEAEAKLLSGVERAVTRAGAVLDARQLAARLGWNVNLRLSGSGLDSLSPTSLREEVAWAWRTWFGLKAAFAPLLIFFEDIHWAKPELLTFIADLAARMHDVPALILCASRPDLREAQPQWLLNCDLNLDLQPLNDSESRQLVNALLLVDALPEAVQVAIVQRADGNPFFVEEIIRSLIDNQLIVSEANRWRAVADIGERLAIPGSIQALLTARIDHLMPAEQKRILQNAAVMGSTFWSGAVSTMLEGRLTASQLNGHLHSLAEKNLVQPASQSDFVGEDEFNFRHALTHDVAYEMLPRASRSQKHAYAAAWLERAAGDRRNELAERIAYHYEQAATLAGSNVLVAGEEQQRLAEKAVIYLKLVAENAIALQDYQVVQSHCHRALALLPPNLVETRLHLDMIWMRANADMQMGNLDSAAEQIRKMYYLSVLLSALDIQAQSCWVLGQVAHSRGDMQTAAYFHQQALDLFRQLDDKKNEARILLALADIYASSGGTLGAPEQSEQMVHGALAIARLIDDKATQARALNSQIFVYNYTRPDFYKAERLASTLLLLLEDLGDRRQQANTLVNLGFTRYYLGWFSEAIEAAGQALELATMMSYKLAEVNAHHALGLALTALGRYEAAVAHYQQALAISTAMGERNLLPEIRRGLAEAHLGQGELDAALAQAEIARDVVLDDDPYSQATTSRAYALVLAALQRTEEAEASFLRSIELLEGSGFKAELATSLDCYAAFLDAQGRPAEAASVAIRAATLHDEIAHPSVGEEMEP